MTATSRSAAAPALEARDVTKVFRLAHGGYGRGGHVPGARRDGGDGVVALDGVTLCVERGETVVLVGESGSGKSTLLRLFNRLEVADGGDVLVAGESVASSDPIALRRRIGYVQQEGGLIPHWTVERNVGLVPELLGWTLDRRQSRTTELLELVGLPARDYGPRYPRELSGGQRQRVAFARAIAADPSVVLLDEPFGALDAITRLELHDEFLRLKTRLGKTFLLVTHDLREAFRLADRIAVMKSGRVLQVARPGDLARHPAHPYVERLLALTIGGGDAERA